MLPVTFAVLGPLTAENAGGPVDLKGPRHRAVLARLLIARGRTVPVAVLAADLWDDPPEGAVGALQTFVSALRRALEPGRPPRGQARLLVTTGGGYALHAEPEAVDAWRFERAVVEAGDLLVKGGAEEVAARLDEALGWWRGPAYADVAREPWALAEARRLDELRLLAVERRAEAALALGTAADAVPGLDAHATGHPWREDAWRLLALALYRTGRQGDALDTLRRARAVLVGELGIDPGPGLRRLESRILAQDPKLDLAVEAAMVPMAQPDLPLLLGRDAELTRLHIAAERATAGSGLGVALVSGEAGAGKTALAERFAVEMTGQGWTTAWGPSPEHEGVPAAWAWSRVLDSLGTARAKPPALTGESSFEVVRGLAEYLSALAARAPLLLVFDDLQFAGESTLELLRGLMTTPPCGPVLILGTHRPTGFGALGGLLASAARLEPSRVYLSGLTESAVGELALALTGRKLGPAVAAIHRRSGGNPFYVRELLRLFDEQGTSALTAVPRGVGEVIGHRLARLAPGTAEILRRAAVLGTDVELDVLSAMAGIDVLDAVDEALDADLLEADSASRLHFTHSLVHDTVYESVSAPRRAEWHAKAAAALESLRPGEAERIAHHYLRAVGPQSAAKAARYATIAATRAERSFAPHEAARLWREVLGAQARAGTDDPRVRLEATMGLVRALAITGDLAGARRNRSAAIGTAESIGDPSLTAEVVTAFDVPAIWTRNDDETLSAQIVAAAKRTLAALPDAPADVRSRLFSTIALETRGTTDHRGEAAAREAERLAGAPDVRAFALNARFMHSFGRTGLAPERARIADELIGLDLMPFTVLGHLIAVQAHAALADFGTADEHVDAVNEMAARRGLPLVGVFTEWYGAMRLAVVSEDHDAAEAAYRHAAVKLATAGMPGMDEGLLQLALVSLSVRHGRPVALEPDWGPYTPWCLPAALLDAGRVDEARAAVHEIPEPPHDLLLEARLCLEGRVARALDDRPRMRRVYTALLPAARELAGAGSGVVSFGPVADELAELATALDRPEEAAAHRISAAEVAGRAGIRR